MGSVRLHLENVNPTISQKILRLGATAVSAPLQRLLCEGDRDQDTLPCQGWALTTETDSSPHLLSWPTQVMCL